uniref:TIMELESS-interacting protein isoform X2 n=1 Tax=Myxine glutinosa TaxID=7769 RepID=UPI00358F1DD8
MEEEPGARGLFEAERDEDDRLRDNDPSWLSEARLEDDAEEENKPVKRIIRKPRLKLDAQRLLSERGLPALLTYFEKVNFKGKGHEADDLHTLLWTLQHWAHRLCPHLAFGDFVENLERLGSKREIQTCMHKIRLDIPVFASDFVTADMDDKPVNEEQDLNAPPGTDHSGSPRSPVPAEGPEQLSSEILVRLEEKRKQALERRRSRMQASLDISAGSSQLESYLDTATQMLAQPEVEATVADHLCDGNEVSEASAGQDVVMEVL